MTNVYHDTAYRSDAIPALPSGGHPDMDKVFQRLPWGRCQNPIVPNTMAVQLAYAGLFKDESDTYDGFPWGESVFSVSKGFLSGLQGSLYILYMCAWLAFFISFLPLAVGIIGTIMYRPNIEGVIFLFDAYKYMYLIIAICYFGGKYGRLLLAHLTDKRQRANPTGLYRREGVVRIKERKSVFEAPFIEFDAYLIHTPSGRGGRYFNLVLQHRYSKHPLWMKGLVTDAMNQNDVYAYWDMVQQFMDVSGPLPDVPIFEPFRSRDPVTREWDERTDRDPFKWRKVTSDSWRTNHEQTHRNRLQNTNFHHPCILDARIQGRGLPMPDEPRGAMLA
ncbi:MULTISPECIES: hypothetical protein [unclassified Marinobacter]|uniref:hypothetical protein n=1 Tax=unclassified Marinobacter TaxID=83889 RepID=UPI00200EE1B7|nr:MULTISPECIES: hypothetical protein [unclassified Marinobacter]UQG57427.1 hypothetical protein MIH16_07250 [Marinobacter sp. M4C]UQG66232.1 hypothetical protein MIH17_07250 [Marinobacter sp. M2C]UQG70512.1 hypothetical protein MIH19_07245 [Marinobacter sp. M1C]